MKKFKIKNDHLKAGPGFTIKILDSKASIQDLLDELNGFFEKGSPPRLWPPETSSCQGCHLCCHEPLPVTSIDVINICRALHIELADAYNYLTVNVRGNIVDITLKRKNGSCIFLNRQGRCSIYSRRPFICQTYICCHSHPAFEEMRSQVVNRGMDELVRMSLIKFEKLGKTMPVASGSMKKVRLQDWTVNCFSNRTDYRQVLLENVLSSALMKVLLV